MYPGLNANKIQIPYDKHHKVSSLAKSHQNTHDSVKYKVILDVALAKCQRATKNKYEFGT